MKKQFFKKTLSLISSLVLVLFISISPLKVNSQETTAFKSAGKWLVGLKVLNLDPDEKSVTSIGGEAKVDDDTTLCLVRILRASTRAPIASKG